MSDAQPAGRQLACHCRRVYWDTLEHLVDEEGVRAIATLSRLTMCCTGWGCCRWDIEPWVERRIKSDTTASSEDEQ